MGKADEAFGGQHRVPDAAAGADAGSRFERGHARKGEGMYGRTRTVQLGYLGYTFSSTARCFCGAALACHVSVPRCHQVCGGG